MNKTTFLLLPGYMVMVLFFIFSLLGLISCIFGFFEMSRDPLPIWVIEESPDEGYTCWRHRSCVIDLLVKSCVEITLSQNWSADLGVQTQGRHLTIRSQR